MRRFWSSAEDYDRKLKDTILLTKDLVDCKESHMVWGHFQHKFALISGND